MPTSRPRSEAATPRSIAERWAAAGMAAVLLFFLASGTLSYLNLRDVRVLAQHITRTHDVIVALGAVLSAAQDAETGQRGYLLTGNESYLQPYREALDALPTRLDALAGLTRDNPMQQTNLVPLRQHLDAKLSELRETIDAQRSRGREAALAIVDAGRGKAQMDAVRARLDVMREEEGRVRATRLADLDDALTRAVSSAVLAALLGALLTILVYSMVRRNARARATQAWLQHGKVGLAHAMAGEKTVEQVADSVLAYLSQYVGTLAGAVFKGHGGVYQRVAALGVPPDAPIVERFRDGEGLLGQVTRENRPLSLNDVPDGYLRYGSALGQGSPRHLWLVPLHADERVNGAIELGFDAPPNASVRELVEQSAGAIGVALRSARYRAQLQEALEQTQRQAGELQAQSEELRVSNEELEEQGRALKESQTRLEQQQAELEQTNSQLEEQAQTLATQRDELERTNAAVEMKARELEAASRYKSDFLANMSHELRTPLNSLLILSKLLGDNADGNLTSDQVQFARTIESSGNDLLTLINDILDLSKIEAGHLKIHPEPVPLQRLCRDLRQLFQPMADQRQLAFEIDVAPGAPESVETDRQRLEQVLKNLLSNAFKFTERGTVRLALSAGEHDTLRLAVSDTGIGIAPEQRERIFEAFHQADGTISRRYGGTGLGLSISRELTRLLGGRIGLDSEHGAGSTFTVTIPTVYSPARVAPRGPAGGAGGGGRADEAAAFPDDRSSASWVGGGSPGSASARSGSSAGRSPVTPGGSQTSSVASGSASSGSPPHGRVATAPAGGATGPRGPAIGAMDDDRHALDPERRRLLIVEDDATFASIVCHLAREAGFQCLIAGTAQEAIDLARRFEPHAIVLDVGLPDQSGLTVLDRLKHDDATRHIPIHIISAADHSQTAMALGAVGYLTKPVKREQLASVLRQLEAQLTRTMRRVLIVEDDAVQRDAVSRLLSLPGVETVGVGTAGECLALLGEQTFDCMVLDLSLPDASGYSLLETLSAGDHAFPPVIVYTGRELSMDEEQRLRRYSHSIIIKGAKSPERLLDEVSLFLHQVVSDLPAERQRMIRQARNRDAALEGRRILIVEDDVRNVYSLSSVLEPRGAKVTIARNGQEAIDALTRAFDDPSQSIDLVLMDVMMPVMDGLTATRQIRGDPRWRELPIVMLTAKAMPDDQERCIQAGANDYMAKPVDVDRLLSLVRVWMPR